MVRMLFLLVAGLLAYAASARGEEATMSNAISFYRTYALKSEPELSSCVELFNSLRSRTVDDANVEMRQRGCFDQYTGFVGAENGPGKYADYYNTDAQIRAEGPVFDIRIMSFDKNTGAKLKEKIAQMRPADIEAIKVVIIDLRDDPGGAVLGARDVLETFAPKGGMRYLRSQSRCRDVGPFQQTKERGALAGKQYVLLVTEETASASEIVIGTMRYEWYPDATVIIGMGTDADHTLGKSVMQLPMEDESFRVTCGRWTIEGKNPLSPGVGIAVDKKIPNPPSCGWDVACVARELGITAKLAEVKPK